MTTMSLTIPTPSYAHPSPSSNPLFQGPLTDTTKFDIKVYLIGVLVSVVGGLLYLILYYTFLKERNAKRKIRRDIEKNLANIEAEKRLASAPPISSLYKSNADSDWASDSTLDLMVPPKALANGKPRVKSTSN